MEKKITKKELFEEIRDLIDNDISKMLTQEEIEKYVNFIDHEIELLDRKAQKRGTTANKQENEKIADIVLDVLNKNKNEMYTITELLEFEPLANFTTREGKKLSNQKLSAIITQLKNSNFVENIRDKKKSMFKIAQ